MIDKNTRLKEIINDSYMKKLIDKYKVTKEELNDNFHSFNSVFESISNCRNCKSLDDCKQRKKGEYVSIAKDGIINNTVVHCKYYLQQAAIKEHKEKFIYSDIADIYNNVNLDTLKLETNDEKNLWTLLKHIEIGDRKKGIYIQGDVGVGKTYMCIALANSLVEKNKKVAFIKINDFATKMSQLIRDDASEFDYLLNKIKKVQYLIIDDIGSEIVTDFLRDRLLLNILDYRMENKLLTIFTSNIDKASLQQSYSGSNASVKAKRLIERIDILSDDYLLEGVDKRRV